ncbi:CHAT domain-containing protein [Maribellus sediminis]|uniref:CHAT domain-containing protein n=1 Tax=Maribellus sediminis TaxID=2696285 RepID=UPI00143011AD|nr:CHAT domain-containing tetratricopeptide repeat protein [Maribellus sediminis]
MSKSGIFISLFLFLFFPHNLFSQEKDSTWYADKSEQLYLQGIQLFRNGDENEALDTFLLCLKYKIQIYGQEDYELGKVYNALGIVNRNLNRNDKAIQYYKLTESNYKLNPELRPSVLAGLYTNIGAVYRSKLDYVNALNYYERGLNILLKQETPNPDRIDIAYYSIAELNFLIENYEKAMSIAEQFKNTSDTISKIYWYTLLANIEQELDNLDKARIYHQHTIDLARQYYGENDIETAIAYLNFAVFESSTNNYTEGTRALEKAYNIIRIIQPHKGLKLSNYYEFKGNLLKSKPVESSDIYSFKSQKIKNLEEAISWYKKSLNALFVGEGEAKIEELTIDNCLSFTDCMILLKTIADTHNEMALLDKEEKSAFYTESLDEALRYYKVIGNLISRARMEISGDESKIQLAQLEYETFTKTIETAYLAYEANNNDDYLELAFNNSEQLKSSAVFDKISNDIAQENSLIPDSLLELESNLNNTISIYNERLFTENSEDEPDTALLADYNTKIFEASRQRDELNRFLEQQYPDYYDLKYSKSMLSIEDAQNMMDKKDAILEYVLTENDSISELFTFLITADSKKFLRQAIDKETAVSMEYMYNFMTTPDYLFTQNDDIKQFCVSAHNMYKLLVQPISEDLINKNLTIIPDGKLNYIAFDGLIKTMPDTSAFIDFSRLDYLVRHFNVNYANSMNILMKHRAKKRNLKNQILAFAPVYNNEKVVLSNANYTLLPLPGVQSEVDAISNTVKTDIFRGTDATEEEFRALCQNYEILHLAMHAYINDSLPAFSRLAFSPVQNENDLQKDGWLNTADIYNLNLRNARLTVLSACNTGVGKMQKGEGLMSLARGFLYAGCPSIIMSLWEVEDNAGTQIMTSFYKYLKNGKTKDEALRLAKIDYLDKSNSRLAHPHYWMSFKAIGDPSPIYTSNDIYFFGLLIILIVAFAIDQGLRMKKARRKQRAS